MMEMISKRLTKIQKAEILEAYRAGDNTNFLAEKYSCTTNTINRTVKTLISDNEFSLLKEKRAKNVNKKRKLVANENLNDEKDDLEKLNSITSLQKTVKDQYLISELDEESIISKIDQIAPIPHENVDDLYNVLPSEDQNNKSKEVYTINQNFDNNLELIAPLVSNFDFDSDKSKIDFEILHCESLPESVYMIVDKKVELELQLISDLPEWSFLPENELRRNAIVLFSNQRSAKRSCLRNQRVIKIPNTSIFQLSKSYLISKGITRLILEDSIIALDI